jgi:hypothetical protein
VAEELYARLAPHAGQWVAIGVGGATAGSVQRVLGVLATLLGRLDAAERHLRAALAAHERAGARPWVARTQYDYARLLLRRAGSGDRERADRLLDAAAATADALGMAPLRAAIEADRPQRRRAAEPAPATLAREGEYWAIGWGGRVVRVRDSKGVRHLARLLGDPHTEVPARVLVAAGGDGAAAALDGLAVHGAGDAAALDGRSVHGADDSPAVDGLPAGAAGTERDRRLDRGAGAAPAHDGSSADDAAPARSGPSVRRSGAPAGAGDLSIRDAGDDHAGELLDAAARRDYRRRAAELETELDRARRHNDPERAELIRGELEALARELSRAVGLGGRPRVAASAAERARLNATRAIRTAIRRIAELDPRLGAHLEASVRTGSVCRYAPSEPVTWRVTGA